MRTLHRRESSNKAEVLLLRFAQWVDFDTNAVVTCRHLRHFLLRTLKVADRDVVYVGIIRIEIAQPFLVRMMHSVDKWKVCKPGACQTEGVIQVHDIAVFHRICNRPESVVRVLQIRKYLAVERPL